jgi:hypothetical protein
MKVVMASLATTYLEQSLYDSKYLLRQMEITHKHFPSTGSKYDINTMKSNIRDMERRLSTIEQNIFEVSVQDIA